MKCPKNVPLDVFEYLIDNEILSLSYLMRKFKKSEEESRKILNILSKLFEFVDYDDIGPIRIKTCENPKKMINYESSINISELDEYLKTMYKGNNPFRLYEEDITPHKEYESYKK